MCTYHKSLSHHITAKQSVFNTLAHRARVVLSTQDKLDRELQHIKTALQQCHFPDWALNQWQHKFINPSQPNNNKQQQQYTGQQQQQKKHHHCCTIYARDRRKVQENVQKGKGYMYILKAPTHIGPC